MRTLEDLSKYIQMCWKCRHECQTVLFNHCLEMGGSHVETEHVKVMTDCIQICQVAADSMVRQSPLHVEICKAAAVVCEVCADSCESLDGEEMQNCAEVCRECASFCRDASHHAGHHPQQGIEGTIMA